MTMEKKGTTNVPIPGVDDERSITATFAIRLDKTFRPMQLIYKVKTNQKPPQSEFFAKILSECKLKTAQQRKRIIEIFKRYNFTAHLKCAPNSGI